MLAGFFIGVTFVDGGRAQDASSSQLQAKLKGAKFDSQIDENSARMTLKYFSTANHLTHSRSQTEW
jgi:hypothetical protein